MQMYPATCCVCGGDGVGFANAAFSWTAQHTDPRVCAENLRYEAEQLRKENEKLKEQKA